MQGLQAIDVGWRWGQRIGRWHAIGSNPLPTATDLPSCEKGDGTDAYDEQRQSAIDIRRLCYFSLIRQLRIERVRREASPAVNQRK